MYHHLTLSLAKSVYHHRRFLWLRAKTNVLICRIQSSTGRPPASNPLRSCNPPRRTYHHSPRVLDRAPTTKALRGAALRSHRNHFKRWKPPNGPTPSLPSNSRPPVTPWGLPGCRGLPAFCWLPCLRQLRGPCYTPFVNPGRSSMAGHMAGPLPNGPTKIILTNGPTIWQ
jgi:hypothetical protein